MFSYVVLGGPPIILATIVDTPSPIIDLSNPGSLKKFYLQFY